MDSYSLELKDKGFSKILNIYKRLGTVPLKMYADICWAAIKKEKLDKKYKNCWIVPISISDIKGYIIIEVDILKPSF